jgi:hypothetical protein
MEEPEDNAEDVEPLEKMGDKPQTTAEAGAEVAFEID